MTTLYKIYSANEGRGTPCSRPGQWFQPESRAGYRKTAVPGLKKCPGSKAERGTGFGAGQIKQS